MTDTSPERDPLLDRLAETWSRHDPAPSGLVDRSLRTVHAELEVGDVDLDLELLVLLDRSEELAGTRGHAGPVTLQFAGGELQLLVRVTPIDVDQCRIDGWLTPDDGFTVTAIQGRHHTAAVVAGPGRFEFATLRRGATRLVVAAAPQPSAVEGRLLGTSPFDL